MSSTGHSAEGKLREARQEIERLGVQLTIANAEIVRLSTSREEIREQLEADNARLKAELAEEKRLSDAWTLEHERAASVRETTARKEERGAIVQIVRAQPYYPDTNIGMRQQWIKDQIESTIRARFAL